jgi:hypothetical protein
MLSLIDGVGRADGEFGDEFDDLTIPQPKFDYSRACGGRLHGTRDVGMRIPQVAQQSVVPGLLKTD